MRSLRFILFALLLTPFGSLPLSADPARVEVQVDGLSCPFCAFGMEKRLRQLEGLEDLEILVDKGEAVLTFRQGHPVDFDAVQGAIRKGGFTPKAIRATLTGTLAKIEERLVLRMDGPAESLLLSPGPGFDRLEATLKQGERVSITGEVRAEHPKGHGEHPYAITVQEFRLAGKPSR